MKSTKLETLENEGYVGVDADLATSLFEYGMIWILRDGEYNFIYGVEVDNDGYFISFDNCHIKENVDYRKEYDWADFEKVESFIGTKLKDIPLVQIIEALVDYYGHECVFGTSYPTFTITEEE